MSNTVNGGFTELHSKLTASSVESDKAKTHRKSIKGCLESNLGMTSFFRTGSFGHGTSISNYSDVDYFAEIPRKNLKQDSGLTLQKMKEVLENRFPSTGVAVQTPTVLVPFGTKKAEHTEICPADYIKTDENGFRVYEIPDSNGGWMKSSPDAHNSYVTEVNRKLGYKVKPLIRFLKAWKYYRNVPISSFYLEMRVAKYAANESSILYSTDVKNIFKLLVDNELAKLQDPAGVSGYISPCETETKKADALSKLKTALTRAEKAREAETNGKIDDAFGWWDLVFNGNFPSYD